jgi:lipopolysaccharide assembly protein A
MKRLVWIVAALVLTVAAILFTVFNAIAVEITLGFWSGPVPVFAIVLVSLFIGFVVGASVAWFAGHERRRRMRDLAYRNAALTRQVEDMRREQPTGPTNVIDSGQAHHARLVAGH